MLDGLTPASAWFLGVQDLRLPWSQTEDQLDGGHAKPADLRCQLDLQPVFRWPMSSSFKNRGRSCAAQTIEDCFTLATLPTTRGAPHLRKWVTTPVSNSPKDCARPLLHVPAADSASHHRRLATNRFQSPSASATSRKPFWPPSAADSH